VLVSAGALVLRAPFQMISSAPPLILTDAADISILAAPMLSSIPAAVIDNFIGMGTAGAPTSMVSPPAPGRSLSCMVIASVFHTLTWGTAGAAGTWPAFQKQPVTIGRSGSPASNSTQIPAPTGGTANSPTPSPAYGTHTSAQLSRPSPSTAGTCTCTRPRIIGSMFCATVPRYFP
jgi:hypothetical protein